MPSQLIFFGTLLFFIDFIIVDDGNYNANLKKIW
jgi:hypothetical protein